MNTAQFLIQTIVSLYSFILIMKVWFQYCRIDFYHPLSQILVKLTQPILGPLRKLIPTIANIDFSALGLAFILCVTKFPLILLINNQPASDWPIYLLVGLLSIIKTFGQMIFWAILIRAISSWFSQINSPAIYLLYQVTEPLLGPIRRILPKTGMFDFSVMLLAFLLILMNNLFYDFFGAWWLLA